MYSRTTLLSRYLNLPRAYLNYPHNHRPFAFLSAHSFGATSATMADATSGVSADSLRAKLIEQLQAQHVEIEDLSGMILLPLLIPNKIITSVCDSSY